MLLYTEGKTRLNIPNSDFLLLLIEKDLQLQLWYGFELLNPRDIQVLLVCILKLGNLLVDYWKMKNIQLQYQPMFLLDYMGLNEWQQTKFQSKH